MRTLIFLATLVWGTLVEGFVLPLSPEGAAALDFERKPSSKSADGGGAQATEETVIPEWWVEAASQISFPEKMAVQTDWCKTRMEAEMALDRLISQAARDYFGNYLKPRDLEEIAEAREFLRQFAVVEGRYQILANQSAAGTSDNGLPMGQYRGFAQVAFSEALWQKRMVRDRLVLALVISGTLLGGLATTVGFLHLNHATKGMYSSRLQILAGAAFVLLAAAVVWISRFVL